MWGGHAPPVLFNGNTGRTGQQLTTQTPAAPSRFLASKRSSTQQSHTQTPNIQQHTNGPSQFRTTPRFAASTPRPSATQAGAAFATPVLAIKSKVPRTRSTQDIIDDSSPISPHEGSPSASPTTRNALPEPIEFDSSLVPQSPTAGDFNEGRSPKRRRISIASSETDPVADTQQSEETDLGSLPDAPDNHIVFYHSDVEEDEDEDDANISPAGSSSLGAEAEERLDLDDSEDDEAEQDPKPNHSHDKPAFRTAPRFKLTEPPDRFHPDPDAYLAADIFSPQRRGAKYLPGGLAAELRDWLVDVKGGVDGEGEGKATSSALGFDHAATAAAVRVVVDQVSHGGLGMTLVSGRLMNGGGIEGGLQPPGVRVVLAGEGNIEGLGGGSGGGNRGRVAPGAVVVVAPPAWDVELDGQWAVAYRWEVVTETNGDGG
ncbi:hypothetical protein C8A00DRAFT_39222 [Chaetomidium leptoderma]|uniref:Uncharacterized protein n=1 Tax=Chaetomidium leptoderma TaxID=669021 RepID=A0AAN6VVB3_9PEZI|nr:hypothetical protein C8A00DRAFT_39222 [Chaetomidium leptoderma]